MKTIDLKVQKREGTGKRTAKDLRKAGRVPGVIYHNAEATNISVDIQDVRPVLYTEDTYLVNLDVEGEQVQAIVRQADFHPVTDILTHVEFLRVTDEKPVSLTLPIKLTGTAAGVIKGGKMAVKLRRLKVKGIISKLPERVEVDVTPLDLGESIKVMDAKIDGINVLTAQSAAIATVIIPRALRSAKAAEAATE
ncbi:MAG: 50S ribosomal protein L25 [Bacteroidia bacterium]|nr:50S ribosomal protein L25 [Bacteroidia bacterium]